MSAHIALAQKQRHIMGDLEMIEQTTLGTKVAFQLGHRFKIQNSKWQKQQILNWRLRIENLELRVRIRN